MRAAGNPHNILKGGKDDGNRAYVGQGNLRVTQPKGGVGTTETGLLFQVRLPEALRTATLSYKFKFSDDYDWTSGGKLPGLCDEGTVLDVFVLAGLVLVCDGYKPRITHVATIPCFMNVLEPLHS